MADHIIAVNDGGLLLLGCGKMGSAMLRGWFDAGVRADAVTIIDPYPSDWLLSLEADGLSLNPDEPGRPKVCVLAVKPQMMGDAAPRIAAFGDGGTMFVSVAAGTTIATLERLLSGRAPIVRAMPNTPAAVGRGITALIGNGVSSGADLDLSENLLQAVGKTVRLQSEDQMDAVTAVSGSGPAYVFHLIEVLAAAGEAEGLDPDLALSLARATVGGAGHLAEHVDDHPAQLRVNVTSPGGTTAAALDVLMDDETGFPALVRKAVTRAAARSRELGAE
ncbi:pyrroline-5-carboxylate reductase [Hoeflea sp. TYP-13]|uniref:pyrroline-5-carboxylate reductase n=1 Tax=Hoeflea sp. TYP-13 TaxID=3230023 RepID=UPI0034C642D6